MYTAALLSAEYHRISSHFDAVRFVRLHTQPNLGPDVKHLQTLLGLITQHLCQAVLWRLPRTSPALTFLYTVFALFRALKSLL
jgi:hypothetical protein